MVYASAGLLALVLLIGGAAGGVVAAIFGGGEPAAAALACTARVNNPGAVPAGLSAEQARNAAVIIGVGQRMGIPVRGWVIAIATALQESDLINSGAATDHDSLGLFQQRPSQGWGTPAQIMDPAYASAAFYTALRHVPGWQSLPLTVAAQRVQKSATPDAYQKHEARATAIVAAYTGGAVCDGGDGTTGAGVTLPPGFRLPPGTPPQVVTAIGWALAQLGTPYAFGGDCTAARSGDPAHECDCSSLVQQAYRAAGVGLPRVTGDQVHAGTPVATLAEARPHPRHHTRGRGHRPRHRRAHRQLRRDHRPGGTPMGNSLIDDERYRATCFVVIDFEATTPTGRRPEPIDVAAIALRPVDGQLREVSRFTALMRPPEHAPRHSLGHRSDRHHLGDGGPPACSLRRAGPAGQSTHGPAVPAGCTQRPHRGRHPVRLPRFLPDARNDRLPRHRPPCPGDLPGPVLTPPRRPDQPFRHPTARRPAPGTA